MKTETNPRGAGRPKKGIVKRSYVTDLSTHNDIQKLVESRFINQIQSANLSKCEGEALKRKK